MCQVEDGSSPDRGTVGPKDSAPYVVTFLKKFTNWLWKFGFLTKSKKACEMKLAEMKKARSASAASRRNTFENACSFVEGQGSMASLRHSFL
jgi:hypothetical protein